MSMSVPLKINLKILSVCFVFSIASVVAKIVHFLAKLQYYTSIEIYGDWRNRAKVSPMQTSLRATIQGRTQHFLFLLLDFLRFFEFFVFL
jgi:hypothetical protein